MYRDKRRCVYYYEVRDVKKASAVAGRELWGGSIGTTGMGRNGGIWMIFCFALLLGLIPKRLILPPFFLLDLEYNPDVDGNDDKRNPP